MKTLQFRETARTAVSAISGHLQIIVAVSLLGICMPVQADKRVLSVRVAETIPYMVWKDGTWTGLSVEIVRAVATRAGYEIRFEPLPRRRAFDLLRKGELDIMLNLTQTAEREAFLDFIGLSSYEQMVLVVRRSDVETPITSLDDFVRLKKTIGARRTYFYPQLTERLKTDEAFSRYVIQLDVNRFRYMLRQLKEHRYFGTFEDVNIVRTELAKEFHSDLAIHQFTLNEPQVVHIAVSRATDAKIRDELRQAHAALWEEGVIHQILQQWDGLPVPRK